MSGWKKNKYRDFEDENGWIENSYSDQEAGDNVKLIRAAELRAPLVDFRAVREGFYFPYYPIVIAENDAVERKVRFPLDQGIGLLGEPLLYSDDHRSYADSVVRTRLHQPLFRARVLRAYATACTVCDLQHPGLCSATACRACKAVESAYRLIAIHGQRATCSLRDSRNSWAAEVPLGSGE